MNRTEIQEAVKMLNEYLNGIRNTYQRRYAFAYVEWLKLGCVGLEPVHPKVSATIAKELRIAIHGYLGNEPLTIALAYRK